MIIFAKLHFLIIYSVNSNNIMHFDVINLKETESTNSYARELIEKQECKEGIVISTLCQTKGKGQGSNKWDSNAGENITATWILKPEFLLPSEQFLISQMGSLAVSDCLFEIGGINTLIKWPNDIYFNLSKIAGILIEHIIEGDSIKYSIIGIGININQQTFSQQLPNPISLRNITNNYFDLKKVLLKLTSNIDKRYEKLRTGQFDTIRIEYLKKILFLNEYRIFLISGEKVEAKVEGVNNDGRLVLSTKENKKLCLAMNEVSYCIA